MKSAELKAQTKHDFYPVVPREQYRGVTMEVYMTELEMKVDAEVGNDTEHQRMTLLKYVNYGRRLEREAELARLRGER